MPDYSFFAIFGGALTGISIEGIIRISYWSLLFKLSDVSSLQKFFQTVTNQPRYQHIAWWLRFIASIIGGGVAGLASKNNPFINGALAILIMVIYTLISPTSYELPRYIIWVGFLLQTLTGGLGGFTATILFREEPLQLYFIPVIVALLFFVLLIMQRFMIPQRDDLTQKTRRVTESRWNQKQWFIFIGRVLVVIIFGSLLFSGALLLIDSEIGKFAQWGYLVAAIAVVLQLVAVDRVIRFALINWGYPSIYTSLSWILALVMLLVGINTISGFLFLVETTSSNTISDFPQVLNLVFTILVPFLPVFRVLSSPNIRNLIWLGMPYWLGGCILMGIVPSVVERLRE